MAFTLFKYCIARETEFIASSAPRQTQQIIMSVYDDQVEGGTRCTV